MLSVARSRFHLPAQFVFLIANAVAVLLGVVYNHKTPDLYENEKHGRIGWVSTGIALAWVIVSLVTAYAGSRRKRDRLGQGIIAAVIAIFQRLNDALSSDKHLWFGQSRRDTERNSLLFDQSPSVSTISEHEELNHEQHSGHIEDDVESFEKHSFLSNKIHLFSGFKCTPWVVRAVKTVLDRMMLLFGFLCITTGVVIYGGVFVSLFGRTYVL